MTYLKTSLMTTLIVFLSISFLSWSFDWVLDVFETIDSRVVFLVALGGKLLIDLPLTGLINDLIND